MSSSDSIEWCRVLYERKAPELLLYGRALGLSHAEAEDVLQETFVALMQRPGRPEKPEHYCLRTFRNQVLNYRRGLWRRLTREMESSRWFENSVEPAHPAERQAMECLATLPQEQREVVVLKIWHRYTFEEIASLTEIPAGTVAGRYRYAMQKLKRTLKGTGYEREPDERVGDAIALVVSTPPIR